MNEKQLKASMQLAQMRFDSNPSKENKEVLDRAKKLYKSETVKESTKNKPSSAAETNGVVPVAKKNQPGSTAETKGVAPVAGEIEEIQTADIDANDESKAEKKTED